MNKNHIVFKHAYETIENYRIERPTISTIYFLVCRLLQYVFFSNFHKACNYETKRGIADTHIQQVVATFPDNACIDRYMKKIDSLENIADFLLRFEYK